MLLFLIHPLIAQTKKLIYETRSETQYDLQRGVNMEDITQLHLAIMQSESTHERKIYQISRDNIMDIITERLDEPEAEIDKIYEVAKTKNSADGIFLYNFLGEQLYHKEYDDENIVQEFQLTEEEKQNLGNAGQFFQMSVDDMEQLLLQSGLTISIFEDSMLVESPDMLMIIHLSKFYIETFLFEDQILKNSQKQSYRKEQEYFIPSEFIERSYIELKEGIILQKSIVKQYLVYQITEDDKTMLNYRNDSLPKPKNGQVSIGTFEQSLNRNIQLKISPNPATDIITIQLQAIQKEDTYNIEIIDMEGKPLLSLKASQATIPVRISSLPSGIYIVRVSNAQFSVSKQIIKK
jgi:hypothetical protein